uniref:Cupin_8 domain-containing protein n=1 Tax=Panagrellus redivivus TaxID=6233 RepID=A0A7E4ZYE7_PANRE
MSTDPKFIENVNIILCQESMSSEVYRKYGVTPLGQNFVFVVSKLLWYAVRFIVECDGRVKDPWNKNLSHARLLFKEEFWKGKANEYVETQYEKLINGTYDEFPERVIPTPQDCVQNSELYLKPGDHLRRFSSAEYHCDSIYIGDGEVVLFSSDFGHMYSTDAKMSASIRYATLEEFADNQTIEIVEHCILRRQHSKIVEAAIDSVTNMWQMPISYSPKAMSERFRKATSRARAFSYICAVGVPRLAPFFEQFDYDIDDLS